MVDNDAWRDTDLLVALADPFAIFAFADHANQLALGTPDSSGKGWPLAASDVADAMVDADSAARRPFVGILGCRSGYSLVSDGLLDYLAAEGVSGLVAAYGLTKFSPEGSEWYSEDVSNKFWRRSMPSSGESRSVGRALRRAKIDHDPTTWTCYHEVAVQGMTLFGIPWMTIPRGDSEPAPAATAARASGPAATVNASTNGGYELSATVDASSWALDRDTAPGFDLVTIAGFGLDPDAGPTLPAAMLQYALPAGVEVTAVEVVPEDALDLGTLAIPTYDPGRTLLGASVEPSWSATPAGLGAVPAAPFTWALVHQEEHAVLHLKLLPVRYDAATGATTLYRSLALRIAYATSEPVGVVDSGIDRHTAAPGDSVEAWIDVVNAASDPVELTGTVACAWDARRVTLGRYQVRATATPAGGAARTATRVVATAAGRALHRRLGGAR